MVIENLQYIYILCSVLYTYWNGYTWVSFKITRKFVFIGLNVTEPMASHYLNVSPFFLYKRLFFHLVFRWAVALATGITRTVKFVLPCVRSPLIQPNDTVLMLGNSVSMHPLGWMRCVCVDHNSQNHLLCRHSRCVYSSEK